MRNDEVEQPIPLYLPAGTRIHPAECGFVLPDGRYMRLYEFGLRLELPDGRAASGESHRERLQLAAHRVRVAGNRHSAGAQDPGSYLTTADVLIDLPETLERMGDEDLIALMHLIVRSISEIELRIDLDGGDLRSDAVEIADGRVAHVIDLTAAGPD